MVDYNLLKFKCINKYNDKLFFLTRDENELLMYDVNKQSLAYIKKLQRGNAYFCTSCIVDGKIYYFSYIGCEFCIYDIDRNTIRYVDVNLRYRDKHFEGCSSCIPFGSYIYILCGGEKNIPMIRLDTETLKVECCSQWLDYAQCKYQKDEIINIAHTNLCIKGDSLFLPLNIEDLILEYNLSTDEYKFYELPKLGMCYYTINYDGRYFWLTGDNKAIIKWDKDTNNCIELRGLPNDLLCRTEIGYKGIFYAGYTRGDSIYYAPLKANMFVCINTITEEMEVVKKIIEDEFCFYFYDLDNYGIWAQIEREKLGSSDSKIYVINEGDCKETIIDLNHMTYDRAISIQDGNTQVNEKYPGMLQWFITSVSGKNDTKG